MLGKKLLKRINFMYNIVFTNKIKHRGAQDRNQSQQRPNIAMQYMTPSAVTQQNECHNLLN